MSIMNLTDPDSSAEALLAVLNNPTLSVDRNGHLAALRQLKHRLIGHDQRKLAYVNLGFLEPLIGILESGDENQLELECKTEAAIVVGSLVHGNTALLPLEQLSRVVSALLDGLHLQDSDPKFVQAALRTLNTIFSLPNTLNITQLIKELQSHPTFLSNLSTILNGKNTGNAIFTSAVDLIAKTCPQGDHRWQDRLVESRILAALVKRLGTLVRRVEDSRGKKGVGLLKYERPASVLDQKAAAMSKASSSVSLMSMAKRVEIFQKPDFRDPLYVPPAPPTLQIATLLDAISVIVRDSKQRANQCLFAGWITNILGEEARPEDANGQGKDKDAAGESAQESSTATATPGSFSFRNSEFPPLSPASARHQPSHRSSSMSAGGGGGGGGVGGGNNARETPSSQLDADQDVIEAAPTTLNFTAETESDPESPLIAWLISFIRLENSPLNRLMAMNLLTDLVRAGCVTKARSKSISLSIVPILVRLLDEVDGTSSVSKSGISSSVVYGNKLQDLEWTIRERAPAILATLVTDNPEMQKAAVDAGAIRRLTGMLKRAFDAVTPIETAYDDGTDPNGPDSIRMARCKEHKMKVREGTLKALAAIALFEDEYRKMIIDSGAVAFVVGSMVPLPKDVEESSGDSHMSGLEVTTDVGSTDATLAGSTTNNNDEQSSSSSSAPAISLPPTSAEGNSPSVLIAASYVVRSLSRSVNILRTSLIDYHVSKPLFNLLSHPEIRVKIAATAAICNLVMAFSPMRTGIVEMGVVKVLCGFVKTDMRKQFDQHVEALRLNSMWALKHLVLETTLDVKRDCLRGLSPVYLIDLIAEDATTYIADDDAESADIPMDGGDEEDYEFEEEDEEEDDDDDDVAVASNPQFKRHHGIPFSMSVYDRISNPSPSLSLTPPQKALLDLQEQALDFIRNLIVPPNSAPMIDSLVMDSDRGEGYNDFYGVLEKKLRSKPHREIVHSIVYILVHIAAAQPHHRDDLIQRKSLFQALNGLFEFPMDQVRSGLSWLCINLTWTEDASDKEKAKRRIQQLEEYGYVNGLRWLKKCGEEGEVAGSGGSSGIGAGGGASISGGSGPSLGEVMGSSLVGGGGTPSGSRLSLDVRERCQQALHQIESGGS